MLALGVLFLGAAALEAPAPAVRAAARITATASTSSSPVSKGRSANLLARSGMAAQCNQVRSGTAQAAAKAQPGADQDEAHAGGQQPVIARVGQFTRGARRRDRRRGRGRVAGATLVVGVAAGVVLGWLEVAGALVLVVLGVLLPDEPPPNGSVYCWSPADPPPEATVAAGTANARAPSTSMQAMSQRGVRTQASMATAVAARTVCHQTRVLQDLLQNQELCRWRRRLVLG
jgi:hypothetical protein